MAPPSESAIPASLRAPSGIRVQSTTWQAPRPEDSVTQTVIEMDHPGGGVELVRTLQSLHYAFG